MNIGHGIHRKQGSQKARLSQELSLDINEQIHLKIKLLKKTSKRLVSEEMTSIISFHQGLQCQKMNLELQNCISKNTKITAENSESSRRSARRKASLQNKNQKKSKIDIDIRQTNHRLDSSTNDHDHGYAREPSQHRNEHHRYAGLTWVLLNRFAELSGYTPGALRKKIERNEWTAGVHYLHSPDGRIHINIPAYTKWLLYRN